MYKPIYYVQPLVKNSLKKKDKKDHLCRKFFGL